jgi:hypothetical protein
MSGGRKRCCCRLDCAVANRLRYGCEVSATDTEVEGVRELFRGVHDAIAANRALMRGIFWSQHHSGIAKFGQLIPPPQSLHYVARLERLTFVSIL